LATGAVVASPVAVQDPLAVELDVVDFANVRGRGGHISLDRLVIPVVGHRFACRSQEMDAGVLGQVDFAVRAVRTEPTRPFPRPLGRGSRRVHRHVVMSIVPIQLLPNVTLERALCAPEQGCGCLTDQISGGSVGGIQLVRSLLVRYLVREICVLWL